MRIKDYETYHTNPFEHLVSPHIRLKRFEDKNVRGVPHANLETGETSYLTPFNPTNVRVSDVEEFRKLYVGGILALQEISAPAKNVLCFILLNVKSKSGTVRLDPDSCMTHCGYSARSTYYSAVCDLIDKKFLARKTGTESDFFINVDFFFNGSRMELDAAKEQVKRLLPNLKDKK